MTDDQIKSVLKDHKNIYSKIKALTDYDKQALQFLYDTGTTINVVPMGKHYPPWMDMADKEPVNTYEITLTNKNHIYSFMFYSSLYDTYGPAFKRPGVSVYEAEKIKSKFLSKLAEKTWAYDVLACLNIDYSEDLQDFCDNYGYDIDSKKAEKIYHAVRSETKNLKRLWPTEEQQEKLHEIS